MKDEIALIVPGGGPRNAPSSVILSELNVREYISAAYASSSGVTTVIAHVLKMDELAGWFWREIVTSGDVYSWIHNLIRRRRPIIDTRYLIDSFLKHVARHLIDESPIKVYAGIFRASDAFTFYPQVTSENIEALLHATCWLPFYSHLWFDVPGILHDGHEWMDGGVSDALPIEAALTAGYKRLIICSNFPYNGLPDEVPFWKRWIAYPHLSDAPARKALKDRTHKYVQLRRRLSRLEADGEIDVFRLGPELLKDAYPVKSCSDKQGMVASMEKGRELAERKKTKFLAWASGSKKINRSVSIA